MSTTVSGEMGDILSRVRAWPVAAQIELARHILESVGEKPAVEPPPRRLSGGEIAEMLKLDVPPPTDEEVERIIEEERMKKYGR